MQLTDLQDKEVVTLDGKRFGRVHEVHCDGGRLVALMTGPASFIERLTARTEGRRVPWESVVRIEAKRVVVTTDPPKRKSPKATSASRSRPGTPRPTARRSKR